MAHTREASHDSINYKPMYAPIGDELSDDDDAEDIEDGAATMQSSVFNLTNTIIGSGTLAMPHVCREAGILGFLLLLVVASTASNYAITMLFTTVERLKMQGNAQYPILGRVCSGKVGELVASWSVTLQQLGACTAYVVIMGDIVTPIAQLSSIDFLQHRINIQLLLIWLVAFPLCLLPTMNSLRFVSLASLTCIIAFIITVCAAAIDILAHPHLREEMKVPELDLSHVHFWPTGPKIFNVIPIVCFAFLCHQNTFPVYREMKGRSVEKMQTVSRWSMGICVVAYYVVGVLGYLTFLESVDPDVLNNYEPVGTFISPIMDVVRTGFGFSFLMSYPIIIWEARENLHHLVFGQDKHMTYPQRVLWTIAIVGFASAIGVQSINLDTVLGLVGSTCSPTMVFILPALFFLQRGADGPWTGKSKIAGLAVLVVGGLLVPLGIVFWALETFKTSPK